MTPKEMDEHISYLFGTYASSAAARAALRKATVLLQPEVSVDEAYDQLMADFWPAVSQADGLPDQYKWDGIADPIAWAESLPADVVVAVLYPNMASSNVQTLSASLDGSGMTNIEFAQARATVAAIADDDIVNIMEEIFGTTPDFPPELPPDELPDIDLALHGLPDASIEHLIGLYVAAFDRAAEHQGLEYWAGRLAEEMNAGHTEVEARKIVTADIYWAGAQNGEAGTTLSDNGEYVAFVYQTVLGRGPDAQGLSYWTAELDGGRTARAEFLDVFLTSALQADGDSAYVNARIAVAEYVAQTHITGGEYALDLAAVLDGVVDDQSALAAIQDIDAAFGNQIALVGETLTFDEMA